MSEKRASKKQRELLNFIDDFIKEHEYGPSYREIMRALDYKSVSTVAVHVDGLISAGLVRKTDNSARSLKVVSVTEPKTTVDISIHKKWLQKEIAKRVKQLTRKDDSEIRHEVTVLTDASRILGFESKDNV